MPQQLDVAKEFSEIRQMYSEDPSQATIKVLLTGEPKTGKTYLLRTAPKPVLVHSFDPGGTKVLRPWIDKGEVIVDTRWEQSSLSNWQNWNNWRREFRRLKAAGIFDHIGTYAIDSFTTFADSVMDAVMKGSDKKPTWKGGQYHDQKRLIRQYINEIKHLPCNVVLTGHLKNENAYDEDAPAQWRLRAPGDLTSVIPMLFDEVYLLEARPQGRKTRYQLKVSAAGTYQAGSRLLREKAAEKNTFEPDLKAIMREAGLPTEDKPFFYEPEEPTNG